MHFSSAYNPSSIFSLYVQIYNKLSIMWEKKNSYTCLSIKGQYKLLSKNKTPLKSIDFIDTF